MPDSIVSLNEESLRADLRELVRRTVEKMLNGLLDEEADDLVGAERYERTADREAYRAGHYDRSLTTSSGEVTIHMPKLKGMRFTTAIIERYRRRETSVEEAMIEMYLAGAVHQRCTVHFYRNVLARVPKSKRPRVAAMLRAVHAMESREASEAKALEVAAELDGMKLKEAARGGSGTAARRR